MVGYRVELPKRRELDADLVENVQYILSDYMAFAIFHNTGIRMLECRIKQMVQECYHYQLITRDRYERFQFFIRMLGYGSNFNCVVIIRDYDHDYKVYYLNK